ncbi:MAG: hypothetical protein AAF846_16240 [Chloroflexota bacterium]
MSSFKQHLFQTAGNFTTDDLNANRKGTITKAQQKRLLNYHTSNNSRGLLYKLLIIVCGYGILFYLYPNSNTRFIIIMSGILCLIVLPFVIWRQKRDTTTIKNDLEIGDILMDTGTICKFINHEVTPNQYLIYFEPDGDKITVNRDLFDVLPENVVLTTYYTEHSHTLLSVEVVDDYIEL